MGGRTFFLLFLPPSLPPSLPFPLTPSLTVLSLVPVFSVVGSTETKIRDMFEGHWVRRYYGVLDYCYGYRLGQGVTVQRFNSLCNKRTTFTCWSLYCYYQVNMLCLMYLYFVIVILTTKLQHIFFHTKLRNHSTQPPKLTPKYIIFPPPPPHLTFDSLSKTPFH